MSDNSYTGYMIKTVKTREFLRNFKTLKEQLKSGRIRFVTIDIGDDHELEVSLKQPKKTAADLLRFLETMPKPRGRIRRPDLFGDFSR